MALDLKRYLLIALIFIAACAAYISAMGDTYLLKKTLADGRTAGDYTVEISDENVLEAVEITSGVGEIRVRLHSVSPGHAYVDIVNVSDPEDAYMDVFYVHRGGIVTRGYFFGECTGGWIIPMAALLYFAIVLQSVLRKYRAGVRANMYSYRNVMDLGLIIYLSSLMLGQVLLTLGHRSVHEVVSSFLRFSGVFSSVLLPAAFILFLIVSISNLRLMKMEGRNWRNMLGFALGLCICVSTLIPTILGELLQRSTVIDVHNEKGLALYVEMAVENGITAVVSYLDCILLGTIFFGIKAARYVPAFDKDYVMILGCQIKDDGSLTNLLKGRVDRALEFARMQREAGGKDPVFVPSGGKGPDEVISEAEAMRRYLLSQGIDDQRILPEDRSANTLENFRNSMEIIREHSGKDEVNIAFSTTNYHVFRSGLLASEQGIKAEGIGSGTRSYFWINAFIREFIATLVSERKRHIKIIPIILLAVIGMVVILYYSSTRV